MSILGSHIGSTFERVSEPPIAQPWLYAPMNSGAFEVNRATRRHPEVWLRLLGNSGAAKSRRHASPRARAAAKVARIARRIGR